MHSVNQGMTIARILNQSMIINTVSNSHVEWTHEFTDELRFYHKLQQLNVCIACYVIQCDDVFEEVKRKVL